MNKDCLTWHDVLERKGFETSVSKSLIGFVCWNRDEENLNIGEEISEVLKVHKGKVFARDVTSTHYNDNGLLFFSNEISDEVAGHIFDTIMDHEQEKVYKQSSLV